MLKKVKQFWEWLTAEADMSKMPVDNGTPQDSKGKVFTGEFGDCICNVESEVPYHPYNNVHGILDSTPCAGEVVFYNKYRQFGRGGYTLPQYFPNWKSYSKGLECKVYDYLQSLHTLSGENAELRAKFDNEQFDHPERPVKVNRYVCFEAYKVLVEELRREKAALTEELLAMRKIVNKTVDTNK